MHAAGRGGGNESGGVEIRIYGGTVQATGGTDGPGIGGPIDENGTLYLADGHAMTVDGIPVAAEDRVSELQSPLSAARIRIFPCGHAEAAYTATESCHTRDCPHCLDRTEEPHAFDAAGK